MLLKWSKVTVFARKPYHFLAILVWCFNTASLLTGRWVDPLIKSLASAIGRLPLGMVLSKRLWNIKAFSLFATHFEEIMNLKAFSLSATHFEAIITVSVNSAAASLQLLSFPSITGLTNLKTSLEEKYKKTKFELFTISSLLCCTPSHISRHQPECEPTHSCNWYFNHK